MSWELVTIDQIAERVTKGTTPTTYGMPFVENGINFVKAEALNGDSSLDPSGFSFITEETHERLSRSILIENDVLVSIAGTIGCCGIVRKHDLPANANQAVGIIRVLPHKADARFVYYHFKRSTTRQYCLSIGNQAAQPNVNLTNLKAFRLRLPQLSVQRKIADILSAYDELIEINQRRITLLEQAGREIYREWFVRLRFPGHEHTKMIDGVPEDWETTTYSDVFEFLGGFAFKSKTYQPEGRFGIVTIKNVHNAQFIPECSSRINDVPEKMKEHCTLATGDVLLSLTGDVGRCCMVFGESYLLNQRVAKVIGSNEIPKSFVYWTFSSETSQKKLENLAYGAAQSNLSPVKLGHRRFIKPTPKVLRLFGRIGDPIFWQITTLNLAIVKLSRARDLLLPRLMSGELTV